MPLLIKLIKPKKLKVKEYRRELIAEMEACAKIIIKEDYGALFRTWKHKPKMQTIIDVKAPGPEMLIGTDDEIYRWLDEGTRGPYRIPKSGETFLRFSAGYRRKTTPGQLQSRQGGPYGEEIALTGHVMHPGIKPGNFEKAISKKRQKWFRRRMQAAMVRANKKAGHAI